uniref:ER membrane protein complex subunit 4 n=1 Tax=Cairina moschata TaxID=8855 RepID=A0A8C3CPM7_CAIMO
MAAAAVRPRRFKWALELGTPPGGRPRGAPESRGPVGFSERQLGEGGVHESDRILVEKVGPGPPLFLFSPFFPPFSSPFIPFSAICFPFSSLFSFFPPFSSSFFPFSSPLFPLYPPFPPLFPPFPPILPHPPPYPPRPLFSPFPLFFSPQRCWDVALGPLKQIPMNLFIMYMAGNTISIFPAMMVGMMGWRPLQALLSLSTSKPGPSQRSQCSQSTPLTGFSPPALKVLESSSARLLQGLVFLVGNGLGLALALYKCQAMGLLPTHASDWLAFVAPPQVQGKNPKKQGRKGEK